MESSGFNRFCRDLKSELGMAALGMGDVEVLLGTQEDRCGSRRSGRQCPMDVAAGSYPCSDTAAFTADLCTLGERGW